jgi:hypothetical protein
VGLVLEEYSGLHAKFLTGNLKYEEVGRQLQYGSLIKLKTVQFESLTVAYWNQKVFLTYQKCARGAFLKGGSDDWQNSGGSQSLLPQLSSAFSDR